MAEQNNQIRLNTGLFIPIIGFGTWQLEDGRQTVNAVKSAIALGYRLIDTASIYMNEDSIGKAISESDIPRDEIIITTKLWKTDQGIGRAKAAYENSLKRLGLDYIDLYLIHWPEGGSWQDSWRELEELYKQETVRNIGVSNFKIEHLKEMKKFAHLVPAVNQIELHPFNYRTQKPLVEYCQQEGIVVEAYSPLAQMAWSGNERLQKLANFYNKTEAQIMLRWSIQHGAVPLPKSASSERIKENFDIFDFQLSEAEMSAINKLSF